MQKPILIVIPCFNEDARLPVGPFSDFIGKNAAGMGFMFVNDGSTDGTESLLKGLAERHPENVEILSLDKNLGKAEAVRLGVLAAFNHQPDIIGYWDADLSPPLADIPRLVHALGEASETSIVFGSRALCDASQVVRTAERSFASQVLSISLAWLDIPVRDSQCGAKVFQANREMARVFAAPFVTKWLFDIEIILRLGVRGKGRTKVREVGLSRWQAVEGTHLRLWDFIKAPLELVKIMLVYRSFQDDEAAVSVDQRDAA